MNIVDSSIIAFLNQFSRSSLTFDHFIHALCENDLLKGGALMTMFWWAWFHYEHSDPLARHRLSKTLAACFVVMFVVRTLTIVLPYRPRPILNPELDFVVPYEMLTPEPWSSFPSDHAGLFFALATGLLFVSRRLGVFALAYTALFISFPRLYLGMHYATDILAGGAIGCVIVWLAHATKIIDPVAAGVLRFARSAPGPFYAALFLVSYLVATLFVGLRGMLSWVLKLFGIFTGFFE